MKKTFPHNFPWQALRPLMAACLVLSTLAPSSWARRDDDYWTTQQPSGYQTAYQQSAIPANSYHSIQDTWKPPQPDFYKMPTGALDMESRGILKAMNALKPPQAPESYLNASYNRPAPLKTGHTSTSLTFRFHTDTLAPAASKTPLQDARQTPPTDLSASAPKRHPLLDAVHKAFHAVGNALSTAGHALIQAFQSMAHLFQRTPAGPSTLSQRVNHDFANLKEIRPGTFQTTPGSQTFAQGRAWEEGSTFKATPTGIQLIEGVSMEDSIGGLRKENGTTLPVRMRGTENGGVEPITLDFARMTPGTSLKASSPIDIHHVGTFQADRITYSGEKNGTPILELGGRALSVEGITDPKLMKQATQELSVRLRLMTGSLEVKDAVLTTAKGEKTYLDPDGKSTPVQQITQSVENVSNQVKSLSIEAKQLDVETTQYTTSVNSRLDSIHRERSQARQAKVAPSEASAKCRDQLAGMQSEGESIKTALQEEDYGAAMAGAAQLKNKFPKIKGELAVIESEAAQRKELDGSLKVLKRESVFQSVGGPKEAQYQSAATRTKMFVVSYAQDAKTVGGFLYDEGKTKASAGWTFTKNATSTVYGWTKNSLNGIASVADATGGAIASVATGAVIKKEPLPGYKPIEAQVDLKALLIPGQQDTKFLVTQDQGNPTNTPSAVFSVRHTYLSPPVLGALPYSSSIKLAKGEKTDSMDVYFNEPPKEFIEKLKTSKSIDLLFHGFNVGSKDSLNTRDQFASLFRDQNYKNINALVSWSGDVGNNLLSKPLYYKRAVKSADLSWPGIAKMEKFIKSYNPNIEMNSYTHSLGAGAILDAADHGVKFDTVILLVPAVNRDSFSPGGKYEKAIQNIKHLVVVYSGNQELVYGVYQLVTFHKAMGSLGPSGPVNHPDFTVIDATKSSNNEFKVEINSHSDIYEPETIDMLIHYLKRRQ